MRGRPPAPWPHVPEEFQAFGCPLVLRLLDAWEEGNVLVCPGRDRCTIRTWLLCHRENEDAACCALWVLSHRRGLQLRLQDVPDAAGEVLARALEDDGRAMRRASGDSDLGGWVTGVLRNLRREERRRRKREPGTRRLGLGEGNMADPHAAIPGRLSEPDAGEASSSPAEIQTRLSRLTGRQREVAVLLLDGLPIRRIAARLGLDESTVREHVQSALRKLTHPQRRPSFDLPELPEAFFAAHPERWRRVYAFLQAGRTHAEIGQVMGMTMSALKRMIRRIRHAARDSEGRPERPLPPRTGHE